MDNEIKKFILDNRDLINCNKWEEVYDRLLTSGLSRIVGQFTSIMHKCGIHPEYHMQKLPNVFLSGNDIQTFVIPKNIKTIGNFAFHNCSSLTSITIPNSVTTIGGYAFAGCSSLTSVVIPDSITSIGDYAFYACKNLTSVVIGDSVTIIGEGAFDDCTSLTSITIPSSVTSIDSNAFEDCTGDVDITYQGSKEQWKQIYNRKAFVNTHFTVHCTDGNLVKKER